MYNFQYKVCVEMPIYLKRRRCRVAIDRPISRLHVNINYNISSNINKVGCNNPILSQKLYQRTHLANGIFQTISSRKYQRHFMGHIMHTTLLFHVSSTSISQFHFKLVLSHFRDNRHCKKLTLRQQGCNLMAHSRIRNNWI